MATSSCYSSIQIQIHFEWVLQWHHSYCSTVRTKGHGNVIGGSDQCSDWSSDHKPEVSTNCKMEFTASKGRIAQDCKPPGPSRRLHKTTTYVSMPLGSCSISIAAALLGYPSAPAPAHIHTYSGCK